MDDVTWELIATERRTLADLLESLEPQQWDAPTLCTEWRVRDVAAHLAMTPARAPSVSTMIKALARNRGDLWGAGRDVAVAYADRPAARLVGELREYAGSRDKPVFVSSDNILLDLLVHGQDIAVALSLRRDIPRQAATRSLARIWTMGWPFHASRRLRGVSLRADDCAWSVGSGPVIEGRSADLLLLMTARPAGIDRLRGPGVNVIKDRAAAHRPTIAR